MKHKDALRKLAELKNLRQRQNAEVDEARSLRDWAEAELREAERKLQKIDNQIVETRRSVR